MHDWRRIVNKILIVLTALAGVIGTNSAQARDLADLSL